MAFHHKLILGQTMTGKSTLAKMFCKKFSQDKNVLILDPLLSPEWLKNGASYMTDNADDFLTLAQANTNCILIIDETPEALKRDSKYNWFGLTARHRGHLTICISQRASGINPNLRDQLTEQYIFSVSFKDRKSYVEEFGERVSDCDTLKKGEFVHILPPDEIERGRVF